MIGKLTTRHSGTGRQIKPQIYQNRGRGQNRNYNQRNYQNRYRSNNRSNSGDRGQYRQDKGRPRYKQKYRKGNFRGNIRSYGRQDSRGEYRNNYRNDSYDRVGTGLEKGQFPEIMATIEIGVQTIVGPGWNQEQVQRQTEFDVTSVGNMITLQRTVPHLEKRKK